MKFQPRLNRFRSGNRGLELRRSTSKKAPLEYRKLGNTDIDVSVMALGCWPFAGGTVWGDQDDNTSIATVHASLDSGINFFDTAEGYESGHSERVLGQGLEGRREKAVVATKVGATHLTPEGIVSACEESLRNLGTDYIDLYQIHWPNHKIPIESTWPTLQELVTKGKVRALGVSNFAIGDLSDLIEISRPVANQLPYSLLWRAIEFEILPLCRQHAIGLICYSPLAQGLLAGRYKTAVEVPEGLARTRLYSNSRPLSKHDEPGCEEAVFRAIAGIREVCAQVGASMASVALAWVKQQAGLTSFLVGARNPKELERNLPSLSLKLDTATTTQLEQLTQPVKDAIGPNPDMWMSNSRMR